MYVQRPAFACISIAGVLIVILVNLTGASAKYPPAKADPVSRDAQGIRTGRVVLRQHTRPISSVVFSSDSKTLASGVDYDCVAVWDLTGIDLKPVCVLPVNDLISKLSFSTDRRWLVCLNRIQRQVRVWNLRGGQPKEVTMPVDHQGGKLEGMAFSSDGTVLATTGLRDRSVRLWDYRGDTPKLKGVLEGHGDTLHAVIFSPDSSKLVTVSLSDEKLGIWDRNTDSYVLKTVLKCENATWLAFGQEGKTLAIAFPTLAKGQEFAARNVTVRLLAAC